LRALDLFCGAGGAAMGLHQAGFEEIIGIDINPQPDYPFEFIQADITKDKIDLDGFDLIWASPPCQRFCPGVTRANREKFPDLIEWSRFLFNGTPAVIENVIGAPLRRDLLLCGVMFNLKTYRHRIFEISGFRVEQPRHPPHLKKNYNGDMITVCADTPIRVGYGSNPIKRRNLRARLNITHPRRKPLDLYREVMQMPWVQDVKMISEAVPPAYSEYIGKEFIRNRRGKGQDP
jgi:DNA (cytosine-5)-methyltransferase 1